MDAPRRRVAVIQSNYVPWRGYFDVIHDVDLFVFYDDVQYTKNDWRNRNRIKTPSGTAWLTVPVGGGIDRRICDVELPAHGWAAKHWKTLRQNYSRAPHFERYRPFLEDVYLGRRWATLSELNQHLVRSIARDLLGIRTEFEDSRRWAASSAGSERLLDLLVRAGAALYVSGPAAKAYVDSAAFAAAGIELVWKDYSGYPEYPQLHPPFDPQVSILDLLFHTGPDAPWYVWGWREGGRPPLAT